MVSTDEDDLSNKISLELFAAKSTSLQPPSDEKESELLSGALSQSRKKVDMSTIGLLSDGTSPVEAPSCQTDTTLNSAESMGEIASTDTAMDHSIRTPHNGIGDELGGDDSCDVVDWANLTVFSGDFTDAATVGRRQSQSRKRNRVQSNTTTINDLESGRTASEHETEPPIVLPNHRPEISNEARDDNINVDTVNVLLESLRELSRDVPTNATDTSNNANSSNSGDDIAVPLEGHVPITTAAYFYLCMSRLLCVPLVLMLSVSTVLVVILLVLIPGMLFMAVSVGFYYCCTRDAIPLRVLIQAMLWDTESENGSTSNGGVTAQLSTVEIQAALIRRTCLAVVRRSETPVVMLSRATPLVDPAIQGAADYIFVHDYFTYYFSKPLRTSLDGLSDRDTHVNHSGATSEDTAGLEMLLETMNARHAVSWTDTDDDIASDRAVIQRQSRPRRQGNAVSSRQTLEQEGIEMQALTVGASAAEDTGTSSLQSSSSPQTPQCQSELYDELVALDTPPDVQASPLPPSEFRPSSNDIATITESLDETGNNCSQNFDEIWDNASLASGRNNGINRRLIHSTLEARIPTVTQTGTEAPTEVPFTNELGHENERDDDKENDKSLCESQTDKQQKEDDESCCTSVLRRGIACDICLIHYKVNDVLAWSHNPLCSHVFHSNCIADWMQRNHHCPNCRSDFLFYEHYKKKLMKEQNSSASIFVETPSPGTAPSRAEVHL